MTALKKKINAVTLAKRLGNQSIVLVGMMGSGKTSIGKRLAARMRLPFHDSDYEIEQAANMSIEDIFNNYGEEEFRRGEQDVIKRLLQNNKPQILATGGGAFMQEGVREAIKSDSISIWLQTDFSILMERVRRKSHRPLLKKPDPEKIMRNLLQQRDPIYAKADITVQSEAFEHKYVVQKILIALNNYIQ